MLLVCFPWVLLCFFCKQKTAYEVRISDWSSDVCASDLQIGLISVIVEPFQTGKGVDILSSPENGFLGYSKNAVETGIKFPGAESFYEAFRFVRHVKSVLPCVPFLKAPPYFFRTKIRHKFAIGIARAHKTGGGIVNLFPPFRQAHQLGVVFFLPK